MLVVLFSIVYRHRCDARAIADDIICYWSWSIKFIVGVTLLVVALIVVWMLTVQLSSGILPSIVCVCGT